MSPLASAPAAPTPVPGPFGACDCGREAARPTGAIEVIRSDLAHCAELEGAIVVIDVLRSFTTAACAFAAGAKAIVVAEVASDLPALRARYPGALAVGALAGGAPAPGFDVGNSPTALQRHDLAGRTLILFTEGGVRGLVRARRASPVLAAGLVCARATALALQERAVPRVTLVVTGLCTGRDADEDYACADRIEALLHGAQSPAEPYARRVRTSTFGRRFAADDDPALPASDLDWCAAVDRFDFALVLERDRDETRIACERAGTV